MKIPMIGFAFTMTACFLMTGCSGVGVGGGSTTSSNQLNTAFTTGVTMELEEMTAEGTMQRVGAGEWNVSFSEPSQLAGVRLDFQKGEVTASYKGLAFSVPADSFASKVDFVSVYFSSRPACRGVHLAGHIERWRYGVER